ncbi:uncharacterized protein LOC126956139 [Macaca thibetana thibetana]|uniref:uncharacterized protein LOC126956139 n=1 Tax=Macaca thibetana thibetana TaxID=257877 RepID=UPI0021BCAA8D|nr:uncharacterized protein LOC126956139 [Macaca thibetana thibetana]
MAGAAGQGQAPLLPEARDRETEEQNAAISSPRPPHSLQRNKPDWKKKKKPSPKCAAAPEREQRSNLHPPPPPSSPPPTPPPPNAQRLAAVAAAPAPG